MTNDDKRVRFDQTPAPKEQVKKETDKDAEGTELSVHELEERIAPRGFNGEIGMLP